MNFEMLGNSLPHLHTHVVPRYLDDGEPGRPPRFMRVDLERGDREVVVFETDVRALRELLR